MTDPWQPTPPTGASWPAGLGPALDDAVLAPAPPAVPRRRRAGLTAAAGVLVIATLGFAVTDLTSSDGAASPEAAVQAFFDAVGDEDVIGVIESLEPSERRIVMRSVREVQAQAERLELSDPDVDLRSVPGVDLEVQKLQLETEQLADDVVAVDITSGRITTRAELDELPLGPIVEDAIDRQEEEVDDDLGIDDGDDLLLGGGRLVAVERGGGWHVSLLYSLAEQIRLETDGPPAFPAPGTEIPAVGAADPETAVREAIDAALAADLERGIELVHPEEGRALHQYGPLLVEAAGDATDEPSGVTVSELDLEVDDGPDGTKVVRATSGTITYGDEDVTTEVAYDGSCSTLTTTYSEAYRDEYADEWGDEDDDLSWLDDTTSRWCEGETLSPFSLFAVLWSPVSLEVVVEEHDGAWYLSPSQTILENTVGVLRDLDDDQIARTIRSWSGEWWLAEPAEFWEACGVERPTLETSPEDGEAASEACWESLPDDYEGPYGSPFGGWGTGSGRFESVGEFDTIGEPIDDYEASPEDDCIWGPLDSVEEPSEEEALSCLQDLADDGTIDQEVVDEHRCSAVYRELWEVEEDLAEDDLDARYEEADEAYERCLAGGSTAVPSTTAPTTSTTAPTTTAPSTTAPPATVPD
jgi:hypothetical protein